MPLPFAVTLSAIGLEIYGAVSPEGIVVAQEIIRAPATIDAHFPELSPSEIENMESMQNLTREVSNFAAAGGKARQEGEESVAEGFFQSALDLVLSAESQIARASPDARSETVCLGVRCALDCGDVVQARRLISSAVRVDPALASADEWLLFRNVNSWSDEWLVAAVRRDPPDEMSLDVLVDRHWSRLYGRCLLLTFNQHKASDLAQDAWCRVLRARHTLRPGGNFSAYITTIASNLWRDTCRAARRAGSLAEDRLASLDAPLPAEDDGQTTVLSDILPDLNALEGEDKRRLMLDVDEALGRLSPLLRDVLVTRFLDGESCSDIALRYRRSEQTISSWVRRAVHEMKLQLSESGGHSDKNFQ